MLKILCILIFYLVFSLIQSKKQNKHNNQIALSNSKYEIFKQIKFNILNLKKKLGLVKFGLVIKSSYPILRHLNATYGNSTYYELGKYLEPYVDMFFVGNIYDGIGLRYQNVFKPIMVLYLTDPLKVDVVELFDLEIVIPNSKWFLIARKHIKNKIKAHLWFDSGLGKEGLSTEKELSNLYQILSKSPKIWLKGIGTKYNTSNQVLPNQVLPNQVLPNQVLPNDIIEQHNFFKKIIININDPKLQIHTACSFEVSQNFKESFFDIVRVGTLAYQNIKFTQPLLDIKFNKKLSDCYGYYCANTPKPKSDKIINIGLLANTLNLSKSNISNVKFYDSKSKNLDILYIDYNPIAIIIDSKSKLDIGSNINVVYNNPKLI